MPVTSRDIEKFRIHLQEWQGGNVSFNAFHDDHDRLILRLEHPARAKAPIGLSLFYCSYLSGPTKWSDAQLEPSIWMQGNGIAGLELIDKKSGFVARCASASLFGEPGLTIPQS
jgi:hypothetical protein